MAEISSMLLTAPYSGDRRARLEEALGDAELVWIGGNDSGGRLGEAGQDTFEVELLPSDNALWEALNMLITPQVGATGAEQNEPVSGDYLR